MNDQHKTPPEVELGGSAQDNEPPKVEVDVEADPDIGRVPMTVRFNAVAPDEIDGNACEWSFDDGSAPTHGRSVTHTYNEAGTYTPRLTVTLSNGEHAVKDAAIQVDESEEPPEAE